MPLRRWGDSATEEAQLWSSIREQLRQLDALRDEIKPLEDEYERLQAWSGTPGPQRPLEEVSTELQARLHRAHSLSDNAHENVSVLQALLASPAQEDAPFRKRRRVEASPATTGSAVSRLTSPPSPVSPPSRVSDKSSDASARCGRGIRRPLAATSRSSSTALSPPPPSAVPVSSSAGPAPASGADPARARRELHSPQLPLSPGRKVAFRPPLARGESGPESDCEGWIMATVVEYINNDRNCYIVQDADLETETTYSATLKALVPLPVSALTLPARDYAAGQKVLAVYPDSTTFYPATIVSGGPGLRGTKTGKPERELLASSYQLLFDEDGGDVKSINVTLVVERPKD